MAITAENENICFILPEGDDGGGDGGSGNEVPPVDNGGDGEEQGSDVERRLYGDKSDKSEKSEEEAPKDDENAPEGNEGDGKGEEETEGDEAPQFKPEDYELKIPEDLGLKDEKGEPLQFVEGDPLVKEAVELFVEDGVKPETAQKLMGLYGKVMLDTRKGAEESMAQMKKEAEEANEAHIKAELGKLDQKLDGGETVSGQVRIEKLLTSLDSVLGKGASQKFKAGLINAEIVMGVEELIEKASAATTATKGRSSTTTKSVEERLYGKKT